MPRLGDIKLEFHLWERLNSSFWVAIGGGAMKRHYLGHGLGNSHICVMSAHWDVLKVWQEHISFVK